MWCFGGGNFYFVGGGGGGGGGWQERGGIRKPRSEKGVLRKWHRRGGCLFLKII